MEPTKKRKVSENHPTIFDLAKDELSKTTQSYLKDSIDMLETIIKRDQVPKSYEDLQSTLRSLKDARDYLGEFDYAIAKHTWVAAYHAYKNLNPTIENPNEDKIVIKILHPSRGHPDFDIRAMDIINLHDVSFGYPILITFTGPVSTTRVKELFRKFEKENPDGDWRKHMIRPYKDSQLEMDEDEEWEIEWDKGNYEHESLPNSFILIPFPYGRERMRRRLPKILQRYESIFDEVESPNREFIEVVLSIDEAALHYVEEYEAARIMAEEFLKALHESDWRGRLVQTMKMQSSNPRMQNALASVGRSFAAKSTGWKG